MNLAVAGMVLTLLTAAMIQGLGVAAVPRAIANLNGFPRYPWVTTSFLLTSTIAMPVFAKLSDLYGRKWLYVWSTVIFVVSLLLCGAAGSLPLPLDGMNQLIGAEGLLGIGNGAIIALTFTLVADLFAPSERGRYQGIMAAVFGVAFTVGPPLGGWITMSELFGLKWGDVDFTGKQVNVLRSIVKQAVGPCKTEAPQKPVPLDPRLIRTLGTWRRTVRFRQPTDWVFASPVRQGKFPFWGQALLRHYIRPAAVKVGITKRIGWHTFRHSYSTLLRGL